MQYFSNILCLEYGDLVPNLMTRDAYHKNRERGVFRQLSRGNNGSKSLIEWDSLPEKYKALFISKFGNPYELMLDRPIMNLVTIDLSAREFFANGYKLPDGRTLPLNYQLKYSRQCDWLNMIIKLTADKRALKEQLHIDMDQFWDKIIKLHQLDKPTNPELPTSYERLSRKVKAYKEKGYSCLVEASRFTNDNARKVNPKIENLLISLYCRQEKPYAARVCKEYVEFMRGERQVVDMITGETFDPQDFFVKGKPYEVKPATVQHYINNPLNRATVDKLRMSPLEYNNAHRPYMLREAPMYAFSKLTADDTASPFKMHDGNRPATYKLFDVASGAMVAMVMHSRTRPDVPLIRRMFQEMLQLILRKGWNMPHEIEVERALTSEMKGKKDADGNLVQQDVLSAGAVFPVVHFCAPRNPQEKRAEGFIKQIKYTYQKHREGFQHRPFARLEANRANDESKSHKATFSFDEIYDMERADADAWNNSLHPDQETYPGLTRWQVLEQYQNPNLNKPNLQQVMMFIGTRSRVETIDRGRVQVMRRLYDLPSMDVLAEINTLDVAAYYLPDEKGNIPSIFLYQDGWFLCEAKEAQRYQEARAEQTEDDLQIMAEQKQYRGAFDTMVNNKLSSLARLGTVKAESIPHTVEARAIDENEADDTGVNVPELPTYKGGFMQKNDSSEAVDYSAESFKSRAISGI